MKAFVTALFMLALSFSLTAQITQSTYTCGPVFPTPRFQHYIDSIAPLIGSPWLDGGLQYNDGIHSWFVFQDTAYIHSHGAAGNVEYTIPGSGNTDTYGVIEFNPISGSWIGYLTRSQVFWLNDEMYFADYGGIRSASTGQHWAYDDTLGRSLHSVHVTDGAAWFLAVDVFGDETISAIKFDGAAIAEYNSTQTFSPEPGMQTLMSGMQSVLHDDIIYYNAADSGYALNFSTFNTTTQTFGPFLFDTFPGLEMLPEVFGLNSEGNLVAVGPAVADSILLSPIVQVFNGSSWEAGAFFNTLQYFTFDDVRLHFADDFIVLTNATLGTIEVLAKVDQPGGWYNAYTYEIVETVSGDVDTWTASSPTANGADGSLYLFNANVEAWTGGQEDFCGNPYALYFHVRNSLFTGSGKMFVDVNTNSVFDGLDYTVPYLPICNGNFACAMTNDEGQYIIILDSTGNVVAPEAIPNFASVPPSYAINDIDSNQVNLNFALQPTSVVSDLTIGTMFSTQPPRPGFTINYKLTVSNSGTTPLSDTLELTFDPKFTFTSTTPAELYQVENSIAWLTGAINPLQEKTFILSITLDAATELGLLVNHTAHIDVDGDANPGDNEYELEQEVVGSFDPNDKAANPPYWVQDDEEIQYTVRFQNTGTDTAFNIVVRDTLDENLDWSTFQLRHTSHPVEIELNQQNGALAFYFNNVLLPDSNVNEPASHGIFVYTIKTDNALVDGTPINNTASIYFDFNLPVVTNTTLNVIGEPLSIASLHQGVLNVYPNPSSQILNANFYGAATHDRYEVKDMLGRKVKSGSASDGNFKIDVTALAAGAYTVELRNGKHAIARATFAVTK